MGAWRPMLASPNSKLSGDSNVSGSPRCCSGCVDLLPLFGPETPRNTAKLLMTGQGVWSLHCCTRRSITNEPRSKICGDDRGGMHWGQLRVNARALRESHKARNPHEFRLLGQVGQESNLQPAVLEKAASHSPASDLVSPVVRGQNLSPFSSQAVCARMSLLLSKVLSTRHDRVPPCINFAIRKWCVR